MKTYIGVRGPGGVRVSVIETIGGCLTERLLDPRNDLLDHSPNGCEWGYGGSGPAQLALGMLADTLGDSPRAVELHQDFKWAFVAGFPDKGWMMTDEEIRAWVEDRDVAGPQ